MSDTFEKAWATVKGSPVPRFAQNPGRYRNPDSGPRGSEFRSIEPREEDKSDLKGMARRANTAAMREAKAANKEPPNLIRDKETGNWGVNHGWGRQYDKFLDRQEEIMSMQPKVGRISRGSHDHLDEHTQANPDPMPLDEEEQTNLFANAP